MNITGVLAGATGQGIDRIVLERSGASLMGNHAYVNNIAVLPDPAAGTVLLYAALGIVLRRRTRYGSTEH
jgi:hypothetical protein